MKEKRKSKRKNQLVCGVGILTIVLALFWIFTMFTQAKSYFGAAVQIWDEGWSYEAESGRTGILQLPEDIELDVDEKVVLRNIIRAEERNLGIAFQTTYQRVQVNVDGTMVYELATYNTGAHEEAPTCGWNFVELPQDAYGKEIEIILSSPYKVYTGILPSIKLGTMTSLLIENKEYYRYSYLIDIWLIILGVLLLVGAYHFRNNEKNFKNSLFLGLTAIMTGIWLRTGTINQIILIDYYRAMTYSFIAFYCMPIFLSLFYESYLGDLYGCLKKLRVACIISAFLSFLLQIVGVADLVQMVWFSQALLLLICVTIVLIVMREYRKGLCIRNIWGSIVLVFMVIVEFCNTYFSPALTSGFYARTGIVIFFMQLGFDIVLQYEKTEQDNAEKRRMLQSTRMHLMLSQIQPHFIFNTLGAIRIMIKTNPDMAYSMIYDFSKCLRANLNSLEHEEAILFAEEIKHVKAYTNIQKIRFADTLEVAFDIQVDGFLVPPLSIQPLVGNAITHWLRKGKDAGCVTIRSRELEREFMVEIEDNGVGFETKLLGEDEIYQGDEEDLTSGINQVRYRIYKSVQGRMEIKSALGKGTCVTLFFPKMR